MNNQSLLEIQLFSNTVMQMEIFSQSIASLSWLQASVQLFNRSHSQLTQRQSGKLLKPASRMSHFCATLKGFKSYRHTRYAVFNKMINTWSPSEIKLLFFFLQQHTNLLCKSSVVCLLEQNIRDQMETFFQPAVWFHDGILLI